VHRPSRDLEALRAATRRFLRTIDELTDEQARTPSRLPHWNRAEVITHVARNADGIRGMVEAAARDEVLAMYPGGAEQRAVGIAAGRNEPAPFLLADARRACDLLTESWNALSDDRWDRVGVASKKRPMREFPWVRRREVEVHHVDLDMGYEPSDWPIDFVTGALHELLDSFADRASPSRPRVDAAYRVVVTDHERSWRIAMRDDDVTVRSDDESGVDGEVRGWGCDIAAWLYGRDARGGGIVASGDLGALRLPQWFPYS
jgi:maleylpyruvate isomerase